MAAGPPRSQKNNTGGLTMVMPIPRRAALLGGAMLATPALAQDFPTRPVRMLVTWPPGGTTDILARQFQPRLAALLGQPVVVENRGGASGAIGAAEMARMNPGWPCLRHGHLHRDLGGTADAPAL
jgi:tripartite-type tricarboxylate transporter receptor subunit TctC